MNLISKWLSGSGGAGERASDSGAERIRRHCNGLRDLARSLRGEAVLRVLDLGPTSPQNINYFTSLGHRIHTEDVLQASRDPLLLAPGEDGQAVMDVRRFLAENLVYSNEFFDAILCWDIPDYLHADLVKPVVQRMHSILKPKGLVLSFFHTRDAGPDAPSHRYHIAADDTLELQHTFAPGREPSGHGDQFRLQRIFNNRHIENLFHDFSSIKFFLGRDNIREVLVVR